MVHTGWKWIIPGRMGQEDRMLKDIPQTASPSTSSLYYTSTITIEKRRGYWNYISSFDRNLTQTHKHYVATVLCYPKLFRSKLTMMVDQRKNNMPVTVLEDTEAMTESLRYHSKIILFQIQTNHYITSAVFTPSQLELTYMFSLKQRNADCDEHGAVIRFNKPIKCRTVYWLYRC